MPTFSKLIEHKLSNDSSADIFSRCQVNFTRDIVMTKSTDFLNLRLSAVHTSDELRSVSIPTTRIRRPTDGSNWLPPGHLIDELIAYRMNRARSEQNYSSKTDFETERENQYFERQNISMSQLPLDSTPFGTNTTNLTTSPIGYIPVGTKMPEPEPQTRPMDSPTLSTNSSEQNKKAHVPWDPDPDPSSSDP